MPRERRNCSWRLNLLREGLCLSVGAAKGLGSPRRS